MKYAVISLSGKQYKVKVGQQFVVDKLDQKIGSTFPANQVLLVTDGDTTKVGTPTLTDSVSLKVIDQKKSPKLRVATYKAKSRYRKVKGHRQHQTVVEVVAIGKTAKTASTSPKSSSTKKTIKPASSKKPKTAPQKPSAKK